MKKKTYPKICERATGRSGSEAEVRWRRSRRRKHKMAASASAKRKHKMATSASAKRKHKMAASASARRKMVGRFSEAFSPCNTNNKENPFKKKSRNDFLKNTTVTWKMWSLYYKTKKNNKKNLPKNMWAQKGMSRFSVTQNKRSEGVGGGGGAWQFFFFL